MLATSAVRLMRAASRAPMAAAATRSYALDGVKGFNDRESAQENMFYNKEDERALRALLKKVRLQSEHVDPSASASSSAAEIASLKAIVGKYNVADADLQALLAWKHAHY